MMGNSRRRGHAFTLIEMIGVLAVITILASLLVPKIFESINNAHISQTTLSCQTIKTAVLDHYAKFNTLVSSNGIPIPPFGSFYPGFDRILLAEGLIDQPFNPKLGTSATILLRDVSSFTSSNPGAVQPQASSTGFDLDGDGNNDIVGAQYLIEAVITGMSSADAAALSDRLDGPQLGETPAGSGVDKKGRVIYDTTSAGSNPLAVHIYITHY